MCGLGEYPINAPTIPPLHDIHWSEIWFHHCGCQHYFAQPSYSPGPILFSVRKRIAKVQTVLFSHDQERQISRFTGRGPLKAAEDVSKFIESRRVCMLGYRHLLSDMFPPLRMNGLRTHEFQRVLAGLVYLASQKRLTGCPKSLSGSAHVILLHRSRLRTGSYAAQKKEKVSEFHDHAICINAVRPRGSWLPNCVARDLGALSVLTSDSLPNDLSNFTARYIHVAQLLQH